MVGEKRSKWHIAGQEAKRLRGRREDEDNRRKEEQENTSTSGIEYKGKTSESIGGVDLGRRRVRKERCNLSGMRAPAAVLALEMSDLTDTLGRNPADLTETFLLRAVTVLFVKTSSLVLPGVHALQS
jgi:hypothetical protein